MHAGNYVLILHTHLPWVIHHGAWPHGEDWLTEAAAECYIPLLNVFNDLLSDGIPPKVSLDISPVLCEQLEHPDFRTFFLNYCDQKIKAAEADEKNFKSWGYDLHHIYLAQYWRDWYKARKHDYINRYSYSLINGFKELQDKGAIEVLTCGATHGYFPLLGDDRSISLQVKTSVENYKKHFGRAPRGIWLPECAYRPSYNWKSLIPVYPFNEERLRPGIEQFLAKFGINYFVIDQNLIERSHPIGTFIDNENEKLSNSVSDSTDSPLNLYNISSSEKTEYGTAIAFTRHRDIAMQVWSGEIGYPGEPDYLDFHKKHLGSMLRYWRVTDNKADMMYKTLYHPDWTNDKTDRQSNHFIHHIENTLNFNKRKTGKVGLLCTPFDTELFGHWWFEGPEFIKAVVKGFNSSPYVNMATCSEEIIRLHPKEVIGIPEGSWGKNNNHDVWCNDENKWTWEAIYNNEFRLSKIYSKYPIDKLTGESRRILTQALRELMLQMASDWQFLIETQSAKDYSEQRFSYHHSDFNRLCDTFETYIASGKIASDDLQHLNETEQRNAVFPELQLDWWS